MTCSPTLAATSIGVAVLLATAAAAQPPTGEQRTYGAVDLAISGYESAGSPEAMLAAARQVLDAAESARNAFVGPDSTRSAAAARLDAAVSERRAVAVRCDNGYYCTSPDADGVGPVDYFDGLEDAYATSFEAVSAVSAANAAYVEALGMAPGEARERAARLRHFADRMRGLAGSTDYMRERRQALVHAVNAEIDGRHALHSRAEAAHVAANRAALNALGRAARALSAGAARLTGGGYSDTRAAELARAAAAPDRAAAAAADPQFSNDLYTSRTDQALEELLLAAREAVTVMEKHVGRSIR